MPTFTPKDGASFFNAPALLYKPTCNPLTTRDQLYDLLTPGVIRDQCLQNHIERLHFRFRIYAAHYPYGLWAPGLMLTDEMRSVTETYLPMKEIDTALRHLLRLALRYRPITSATFADSQENWLDFLLRHRSVGSSANPALMLESLCRNEKLRIRFLFEHFLPRRHGGGFNRYPCQLGFLKYHLEQKFRHGGNALRCLDAACGTGEGTYDLARLLRQLGIPVAKQGIHGATIEPLELFAAAHGFFPHDPTKESGFRSVMQSLIDDNALEDIAFIWEDVSFPRGSDETAYDVILCNGLLGGPVLHLEEDVTRVAEILAGRLRPGGIILAADRFHGGWKKRVPSSHLVEILLRCGLKAVFTEEGIAATKCMSLQP